MLTRFMLVLMRAWGGVQARQHGVLRTVQGVQEPNRLCVLRQRARGRGLPGRAEPLRRGTLPPPAPCLICEVGMCACVCAYVCVCVCVRACVRACVFVNLVKHSTPKCTRRGCGQAHTHKRYYAQA